MNIWYSTGENAWLSNLARRPFMDTTGRTYVSVEHAYQTWKSGKFDNVYHKPWRDGSKYVGKLKVNRNTNFELMCKLIERSFRANPVERGKLFELGDVQFTHNQGCKYWREMFPSALKHAQSALV